ncbi:MAG: formyltransferase family protein [Ignavibacteria bacterium]
MKFFYLAFGGMSLRTLIDLISMNEIPEFVVTHKSYLYDDYKEKFYDKLEEICKTNSVKLVNTDKIYELKDDISKVELGVSVGFMEIIKKDIYSAPKFGILNLHCGKLPEYRGRAPISRTIMDGNDSQFITLHKIDSGVDSGPILLEKEIIIEEDDDVNSVYYKCSIHSALLVREGVELLRMGKTELFKPQDSSKKYSPWQKLSDEERKINWSLSNKKIFNQIRAMSSPYPCAFSMLNNIPYLFNKAKPVFSNKNNEMHGCIVDANSDFIVVNTGNGLLMVYDIRNNVNEKVDFANSFKKGDVFK